MGISTKVLTSYTMLCHKHFQLCQFSGIFVVYTRTLHSKYFTHLRVRGYAH